MIEDRLKEIEQNLIKKRTIALETAAREAIDYIISKWPIDSGRSKNGWRYLIRDSHIEIYNIEDYVKYVTYKGSKRNILADLLEEVKPRMTARIKEIMKGNSNV